MNIAVIFDSLSHGGGFSQSLRSAVQIADIAKRNNKFNFFFISTTKEGFEVLSKIGLNSFFFTYNKFLKFFLSVSLLNLFANKFKIKNFFVRYLDALDIDFVIFLGPSQLIIYCDGINFIMSPFDINFKMQNFFPEYLSDKIYRIRDKIIYKSCNQAFKLLVDSQRSKEELCNIYNCIEKKIEIHHFSPILVNKNIKEKEIELLKNIKIIPNKFIFYPAQFWPHKNHIYLLNALKKYNLKHSNKINLVFTGHDKGNLSLIKENIKNLKISDYVILFDYLKDSDLQYLYKKSFAVIFPSLIGSQSLPLFESFFFEKPIMYNQKIIDPIYNKAILKLDVTDCDSFILNMKRLLKNKNFVKNLIKQGKKIYNSNLDTKHVKNKLKNILLEYDDFQKKWNN
jgi:hypothetical protein